jgi:hypothetical protein
LVKEVVSPQFLLHLLNVDAELLAVHLSELGASEGPSEKSGSKGDGSL